MKYRGALAVLVAGMAFGQVQPGPALRVDRAAGRHPISPDIYGFNWYLGNETSNGRPDSSQASAAADLRLGIRRWGGNNMSRYHWKYDVWNIDSDWYFEVLPDSNAHPELLPEGSQFNAMMEYTLITGSKLMGTIPLLGWLPKARQGMCSFSVAKYGRQQSVDPWWPDCGNGIQPDGRTNVQNDPNDAAALTDETLQRDWVAYTVSKYGAANQGGVAVWSLDNEPVWWSSTHRDIHPTAQTYDETWQLGLRYAQAIKEADPTAQVAGPVAAGWGSFFFSLTDMNAGWNRNGNFWSDPVDRAAHGNLDISSWYLEQFRDYEQRTGMRLLDYFDLHFYNIVPESMSDAQRLQSTRVLWDPAYRSLDTYWGFDDQGNPAYPRLIPRMREWVANHYPGTRTALTEYTFGSLNTINGALALADALGIFGREALDLATLWDSLNPTDPAVFAFKIYRNYDGIGGAFGETSVQATTADPDRLAIFAAERSDTGLTLMVINKTITSDLSSAIQISNFTADSAAQVWQYGPANLRAIVRQADASVSGNAVTATFPANAITLIIIPAAPSALPAPKPVVSAVTNAASYGSRIAPGQMVVVWGSNLGPAALNSDIVAGANNIVSTQMGGVRILFDGVPAPMVYVSAGQCAAVVPYLGAIKATTHVQAEYQGVRSDPLTIPVSATGPALFTADTSGHGQGAITNGDGVTPDSTQAPARAGDVVVLWLTGEGVTDPPGVEGRLATRILPKPVGLYRCRSAGSPPQSSTPAQRHTTCLGSCRSTRAWTRT